VTEVSADDTLAICEEILSSLTAAELQLRVLAATHLPFSANARIQHNATVLARALLAEAGIERRAPEPTDLDGDDNTEELLHAALGAATGTLRSAQGPQKTSPTRSAPSALDEGPEGAADVSIPLITDESAGAPFPGLGDESSAPAPAADDEEEQLRQLRAAIGEDEPADATEETQIATSSTPAAAAPKSDFDSLVKFDDADDPLVNFDDHVDEPLVSFTDDASDSLVSFDDRTEPADALDDDGDAVALEDDDDESTLVRERDSVLGEAKGKKRPAVDQVEEFDLIPDGGAATKGDPDDLEPDLDGFDDDEQTNAGAPLAVSDLTPGDKRPGSMDSTAEVVIKAGEISTVGILGGDKSKAAAEPAKAKAAPPPPEPAKAEPPKAEPKKPISLGAPRAVAPEATTGSRKVPPTPSVRDAGDARRGAAIQLNAAGGGKVLGQEEDDELIEMGEADIDADADTGGGFSLQVEEYEDVEEEIEEDEPEEMEKLPELPPPPAAPKGPDAGEIRQMLDAAIDAARAGDNDRAILLFSDVLDGDPDNVDAHIGRGRVYLDLSDYARAMSDFTVAEDLAPENPEIQVAVGDLYFARKDYRKAVDFYNVALEMAPNYGMAYCRRGISHYYRKNYPEAVDDLVRAQKLDPDIANIATFVSMAKKKLGPTKK
jgi:hypothetical protein